MKKCPSFPGYSVNELGEVFSFRARGRLAYGESRIRNNFNKLNPALGRGYRQIYAVNIDGEQKVVRVCRLVLDAFVGPRPHGLVIRHLDGNSKNDSISNLKYGTHQENSDDRILHGTVPSGDKNPNAKLTNSQAKKIRTLRSNGWLIKSLSDKFNLSISSLESLLANKTYKDANYTNRNNGRHKWVSVKETGIQKRCSKCGCEFQKSHTTIRYKFPGTTKVYPTSPQCRFKVSKHNAGN